MLEKLQNFTDGKYDLTRRDIEDLYFQQRGDAGERLEEMNITKRIVSSGEDIELACADSQAKLLQQNRIASGGSAAATRTPSMSSKASLDRKESTGAYGRTAAVAAAAPPPYSAGTSPAASAVAGKKAPPPPPPLKPRPVATQYCTAIFDYEAQVSTAPHSSELS